MQMDFNKPKEIKQMTAAVEQASEWIKIKGIACLAKERFKHRLKNKKEKIQAGTLA